MIRITSRRFAQLALLTLTVFLTTLPALAFAEGAEAALSLPSAGGTPFKHVSLATAFAVVGVALRRYGRAA
jgi:hypothetical protein